VTTDYPIKVNHTNKPTTRLAGKKKKGATGVCCELREGKENGEDGEVKCFALSDDKTNKKKKKKKAGKTLGKYCYRNKLHSKGKGTDIERKNRIKIKKGKRTKRKSAFSSSVEGEEQQGGK